MVCLYLLQGTNQKLKTKLESELRTGARVVSRAFSISGWAAKVIAERKGIFVYGIWNTGPDLWTTVH